MFRKHNKSQFAFISPLPISLYIKIIEHQMIKKWIKNIWWRDKMVAFEHLCGLGIEVSTQTIFWTTQLHRQYSEQLNIHFAPCHLFRILLLYIGYHLNSRLSSLVWLWLHGPLAGYVKSRVAYMPGMPGTFSQLKILQQQKAPFTLWKTLVVVVIFVIQNL